MTGVGIELSQTLVWTAKKKKKINKSVFKRKAMHRMVICIDLLYNIEDATVNIMFYI